VKVTNNKKPSHR